MNLEIKRAIISVWNKQGLERLASFLAERKVEIYATGGTYRSLAAADIPVRKVEQLTDFPEIMNGRVKTLHPRIFGGILADKDNAGHQDDLKKVSAVPFQLVVVNLYPFTETVRNDPDSEAEVIEMIDVGGPSLMRAAAKNYRSVTVLSAPGQYDDFMVRMQNGDLTLGYRRELARRVFVTTTQYDAEISCYFEQDRQEELPPIFGDVYTKLKSLRYGENPAQAAALYRPADVPAWEPFQQLQGKTISYNNYVDCLAAYQLIQSFGKHQIVCANIKHTNPCGVGVADNPLEAYRRAVRADPISYFGGIVCLNREVEAALAKALTESFLECIIAPAFSEEAREILARKKRLRLLIPVPENLHSEREFRGYGSGLLMQTKAPESSADKGRLVTATALDSMLRPALHIGWNIVRHVKSNAIVLADNSGSIGIGAGQMSRVDALKIAIRKAREAGLSTVHTIMASDAFFPFRDSIDLAAEHGIAGIIQPGGSIKDKEVIAACNEHGIFMLFTGQRVFKH